MSCKLAKFRKTNEKVVEAKKKMVAARFRGASGLGPRSVWESLSFSLSLNK
jgi:hypothetical protein